MKEQAFPPFLKQQNLQIDKNKTGRLRLPVLELLTELNKQLQGMAPTEWPLSVCLLACLPACLPSYLLALETP